VPPPILIEEIIKPAEQGRSGPYFCRGADGHNYFVKGRNTGRRSQIIEWICAHLAKALGLPVAPFALVEIAPELLKETPKAMQEIGAGLAFGSQEYVGALWFELEHVDKVDVTLKRDILVFDWWIRNADRLTTNSNLLWDAVKEKVVVIDHNLAFDADVAAPDFLSHHIFGGQFEAVFQDLVEQTRYQTRLCSALAVLAKAYDSVPEEWWWFDDERTVKADFNWAAARALLQRCESNDFWRVT
jgi:hypothetical protein